MTPTPLSRIAGGLLGVAAGDALGVTLEFAPIKARPPETWHRDITGGGPFGFLPGQGSDDTDLTWAVTAAIVDHAAGKGPLLDLAGANMVAWLDGKPRDVGGTTRAALETYRRTGDPAAGRQVVGEWSAGNGSLMRALPTGLIRLDPVERAAQAAALSALTHADQRCTDSCIAYCDLAAGILAGARPADVIETLARSGRFRADVRRAISCGAAATYDRLQPTGYVLDTLAVAVWAVTQPATVEETLLAVVNLGGDADTNGATAGGLLGVRDGLEAIPPRWLTALEYRDRLTEAAAQLDRLPIGTNPDQPGRSGTI